MRKKYRNFNNAKTMMPSWENLGKVSCLLLLLLAFLVVNPISSSAVFAEENDEVAGEDKNVVAEEEVVDDESDDDIMELANTNSSIVGISFSPAMYYASLSPTDSEGKTARIDLSATVNVYNSGGYAVYLKSNDTNLVGTNNSSNVIPGLSGNVTYANIPVNTWGYAKAVDTEITSSTTYKAVAVSNDGDKLAENTNKKITSDSKTINLSFATKINNQKPADTYSNPITLSVVSSPLQVTFAEQGITLMQAMTSDICNEAPVGDSIQLMDTRDGKYYWVSKLADNNCWMTQNLDLDLSTGTKLTSATTDLGWNGTTYPTPPAEWTPGFDTATTADSNTILANNTGQRSWSLGNTDGTKDARITNPNTSSECGPAKNSAANCTSQFTLNQTVPTSANKDENAHYLLGNHYQWNAATAGTGGSITSGQATNSICPKGWRLPTSTSSGEFAALVTALGGTSSTDNLTKSPFYAVRGGYVYQDTSDLFSYAGHFGGYWSSTPDSDSSAAYYLSFDGASYINPSNNNNRRYGFSVRCIAR